MMQMEYNTYEDLINQETQIIKKTIDESPEIGWFKQFYEDIQKIIFQIPYKRRNNELLENPAIYYLILTSTLKIIYISNSILRLISRGYYGQGMNLLRAIQDEYHHLLFFNYHPPNQIKQWNEGKIKSKHIQRYMSTSKHIPKKWKGIVKHGIKLYEILSSFVHPSRYGWRGVVLVDKVTGDNILKILPIYENNSFNTIFIGLMSYLSNTTLLLLDIYERELKDSGIYNNIMQKLKQCESEYMLPTLKNMTLDTHLNIIG